MKTITHPSQEQLGFERELMLGVERALKFGIKSLIYPYSDADQFDPAMLLNYIEQIHSQIDNSMEDDGLYYLASDSEGRNYYLDIVSGLLYNELHSVWSISTGGCTSREYDIFDAAYLRSYIKNAEYRKPLMLVYSGSIGEITTLHYMGYGVKDVFSTPIIEYTVSTKQELYSLVNEIQNLLSESKFFRKLWYRGQRKEYVCTRSIETLDRLGYSREFYQMPSLVPSVGRHVSKENWGSLKNSNFRWSNAFSAWALSEDAPEVFGFGTPMYKDLIRSLDLDNLIRYIKENPYDIKEYFIYGERDSDLANILAMQQYGGTTSMLDITDDLEVALFFSQSFLNHNKMKYELCDPSPENVIYLLTQCRNTCTFNLATDMFKYYHNIDSLQIPPRIKNQKCGLLHGANIFASNTYGYRVIAKIHLSGADLLTNKSVQEVFPSKDEDSLCRTYYDVMPKLEGLYS